MDETSAATQREIATLRGQVEDLQGQVGRLHSFVCRVLAGVGLAAVVMGLFAPLMRSADLEVGAQSVVPSIFDAADAAGGRNGAMVVILIALVVAALAAGVVLALLLDEHVSPKLPATARTVGGVLIAAALVTAGWLWLNAGEWEIHRVSPATLWFALSGAACMASGAVHPRR